MVQPNSRSEKSSVAKKGGLGQNLGLSFGSKWWLLLILILAFQVRLKDIYSSVTDWHAFRQADTASVTREYVKHGIDLLHPRYHDLSNIQSGLPNLAGYRMVEFPIVNALVAFLLRFNPSWDLVLVSRLSSVTFSLGTLICLWSLGRRWGNATIGFWTALSFALLPYAVYYSRAILPEPALLFFFTAALLFFDRWLSHPKWLSQSNWLATKTATLDASLALITLTLALLLKPFVAFWFLMWVVMVLYKKGWRQLFNWRLFVFVILAVTPLLWWRWWITQFPSGIPAATWLFNGDDIRWRPAWVRWLGYERFTKLILGWIGIPVLIIAGLEWLAKWYQFLVETSLGLNLKSGSDSQKIPLGIAVLSAGWVGILLYFSVIATGNVRHDYYQVMTLPVVCLSLGWGLYYLQSYLTAWVGKTVTFRPGFEIRFSRLITLGILLLMVRTSDYYVRGYYSTRPDWEVAGAAADGLLPPTAKVIAPAFGDTAFLFQTNRTGWPIGFSIEEKISQGATHYVSVDYDDEAHELEKKYATVAKTDKYIILDLQQPLAKESL